MIYGKNWNITSIIRLAFAAYAIYYSIDTKEWGWLLFAALLIWQALTNRNCLFQSGSCSVPDKSDKTKKS
ncbi:hypothetical protein OAT16_00680 [Prolixibacteraceae bacterium]|nr:hypothetical protein [Prolixibacteraceae bacterium]